MDVQNNYALKQEGDYFATTQAGTTILDEIKSADMASLNTPTGAAQGDQWDMAGDYPQLKTNKEPIDAPPSEIEPIRLQIGEYGDINNVIFVQTGFKLGDLTLDFSTSERAAASLDKVDAVLTTLTTKRAEFGTVENRLKSVAQSLDVRLVNAKAANSTITDCDIAAESSNYVQQMILKQAASALLVQANTLPEITLKLIG